MKTHLRLFAVAAMIGMAWSSLAAPAAADPPAKAVIAIVGAAHTHMQWYPDPINRNKDVRVKYVWDHDAERAEGVGRCLAAPRSSPTSTKSFPIRK